MKSAIPSRWRLTPLEGVENANNPIQKIPHHIITILRRHAGLIGHPEK
ncbi:MAG TPA: hypothetical protein VJ991_09420 [Balneolales bacterium]|nr:hypothetical protein [Balneolales bacterium]